MSTTLPPEAAGAGRAAASGGAAAPTGTAPVGSGPRRLYRVADGRVVAGVARGLADHLGVDVLLVRLAFIVLAVTGPGAVMYGAFWVFAPLQPSSEGLPGPGRPTRPQARDIGPLVALGSLAVGGLLLLSALGLTVGPGLLVPLVVVAFGVAILWRQADDAQRARWRAATSTHHWSGAARAAAGIALVVIGGAAVLVGPADGGGSSSALVAAVVVAVGLALVSGPWWVRMARDLSAERAGRIREQERAEVAAHVHDSVLHTLTLIQRHVDDPREVARLARAQERELRTWLYRPTTEAESTAQVALENAAAEVEDQHGVAVEVVVVGDCPLDEHLGALLLATREALVNAAKYAGEAPISLYAEVEPDQVTVFVRDRGQGFDPDAVPEDRLGLRQSVVGRMQRHGGTAVVRSRPGEGTEVQLEMPRSPQ